MLTKCPITLGSLVQPATKPTESQLQMYKKSQFFFTAGELQGDFQANSELNQYLSDSETSQDHVFSRP